MRRAHKVRLSREQEDDLQRYARSRTLAARLVERSKMLLLCATGHSAEEIAERLDVTRQTVCRWLSRFEAQGMKGVEHDAPRSGRIMIYPFHALCLESAQPQTHGLTRHVQSLCNFLGAMSRRTQQQHLRPLYQSSRQCAASCIAL